MRQIGVALVGCGEIAEMHARALQNSGGARIVATLDRQREKAQTLAGRYAARPYDDLGSLLADPSIDAVYVLTRHDSHAEIVLQCITAGKNVFCEKPLAMSLEDAFQIQSAVQKSNCCLMVGFNHRWGPAITWLHNQIVGAQSPIRSIELTFATSPFLSSWAGLAPEGGGVMPCLGSHALDLACYLLGESPIRIVAFTARLRLAEPYLADTAGVMMQTSGGAICNLTIHDHAALTYTNYATGEPSQLVRVEVFAESWTATIENSQQILFFEFAGSQKISFESNDPLEILGIKPEDNHFITYLQRGLRPSPNEEDGLRAVQLVLLASLSAQKGCVLDVDNIPELPRR